MQTKETGTSNKLPWRNRRTASA